eukprot:TRINITY_DN3685_c0_g1_i2.p1 TRINITY_DN3685_c0_g1~~TRINITY_DN3685_c0_g1_i2.p1  ORF type:complete len:264 (-),score=29.33 TRINITY_DN3685_c0_g1_i2:285-1004(-)
MLPFAPKTAANGCGRLGFRHRLFISSGNMGVHPRAEEVLQYWFGPSYNDADHSKMDPRVDLWFGGGKSTDEEIKALFSEDIEQMRNGELDNWLANPLHGVAGIILLDQFTRNVFRGTPEMYAMDPKARQWALTISTLPGYTELHPKLKMFAAMPFMHAETVEDQEQCIGMLQAEVERLQSLYGDECESVKALQNSVRFGESHKLIVEKWGRFPHRNGILGRKSTPEEEEGLLKGNIQSF